MSGQNDFNRAFRNALRAEPVPDDAPPPPPRPPRPQSIDGGAGSTGPRTPMRQHSMTDLIRRASRDRE
jgi:hypothetical protein